MVSEVDERNIKIPYVPFVCSNQARNQDFRGGGGANEAKVDKLPNSIFLLSDPFI